METTQIIGSAVGIQYQGISDQSGSANARGLANALIVGDFSRGRFDQPMLITEDTLVQLGDESKPDYQVVVDCLNAGASAVWVMRRVPLSVAVETWTWDDGSILIWDDGQLLELSL